MVTKILKWVFITALLLVVSWRTSASYQLPLDIQVPLGFRLCAGAALVVLALFFITHKIETHFAVHGAGNRSNRVRRVSVRL